MPISVKFMENRKSAWWKLPGILIWMAAVGTLAHGLTSRMGLLSALTGVVVAFLAAGRFGEMPVRLPRVWLVSEVVFGAVIIIVTLLRNSAVAAGLLGGGFIYSVTESLKWGACVICGLTPLLISTRRYALFLAVEAACILGIFSSVLAAHRNGFINRPFFITDRLLERNYDPMPFFLCAGAVLGILLVVWLFSRSRHRRVIFEPALLIALIIALFLFFPYSQVRHLAGFAGGVGNGEKERHEGGDDGSRDPNPSNGVGRKSLPVAVVSLHDDYDPPYGQYYFRQSSLSHYNGRRLVQDVSGRFDTDVGMPFPTEPTDVPLRDQADFSVKGQPPAARRLRTTVALMAPHSKPFGLIDAARFEPAVNPDPKRFERAYKVESIVLQDIDTIFDRRTGSDKWAEDELRHYTLAPDDSRYREIVDQSMAALPKKMRDNTIAQVLAIKFWLDANTVYNLNVPSVDEDADPVANFLFGDRNGYCVHLAHSAVYLFRTLGVPARVSVGYAVEARQRGNGSALLIRSGNAHAWPEVYVRGLGWVVFDISPERVVTPPEDDRVDQDLQRMLGEMARRTPELSEEENLPVGDGDLRKAIMETLKKFGGLLLAIVFAALYLIKFWRRAAPRFCAPARLPVVSYRAALDALADCGFYRDFGIPRERFAQSLASKTPELSELTDLHLRAALGAGAIDLRRERYLRLFRAVSRSAGKGMPWCRRAFGVLNPISWWKVS